jgi:hypothetical protein
MEIIEKTQLKDKLGKAPMLNRNALVDSLQYVSGIAAFDKALENSKINVPPVLNVIERKNGFEFQLLKGFKATKVGIDAADLNDIHIEDKEYVYEEKDKSVLGRALVGGLVLGPVGAIVGGMSGIGSKKKLSSVPDHFITFKGENDSTIVFACSSKKKSKVQQFFNRSRFANL